MFDEPNFTQPNQTLINKVDGLEHLTTPALAVDLPALDRNIARMAKMAADAAVTLRPHAKTHKSVAIAQRQIKAGAVGMCTATLGEAGPFVAAGINDVLITSPAIGPGKPERLLALRRRSDSVKIVIDNPSNVATLSALMAREGLVQQVFVGLDIGAHRIGARTVADALGLANAINQSTHLALVGVFAYAGTLQHIESFAERAAGVRVANDKLTELVAGIKALGVTELIVSGGGTGTAYIDAGADCYTELQVGSYLLMDVEYGVVELAATNAQPFEQSLWVLTRVIGVNHEGFVTTDAGTKRFSMGGPDPVIGRGAPAGSTYGFQGDEHGRIQLPSGTSSLPLETLIWVRPPHVDPTVNLYDSIHVLDGERLVDIWAVEGRGAV